jgi:SAM-dependent methyltransferase
MIKSLYLSLLTADPESRKLRDLIGRHVPSDARILDVGCGYGRNLDNLLQAGFTDVTGIDINPEIVDANKKRGLKCIHVDDLDVGGTNLKFDLLLMSHVIEHFAPSDLKTFIDGYLEHLADNGYLVIATPLMSDYFYDDFDHVKPYQPLGILQVFGDDKAQIQYYAKNKLALRDLWFRRGYWRFRFFRANFIRSPATRVLQAATLLSAVLFTISFGLLGKKDGWIGVFQKLQPE